MTVHFSMNCVIINGFFFFIGIPPEKIEWCDENSLSSFFVCLSKWIGSVFQDRLDAERTTFVKLILPIVRNQNVLHHMTVHGNSTKVSLTYSEASQGFFLESSQNSPVVLLLLWWISRLQCVSEKSRPPCFANNFSNTGLIVSQSSVASGCPPSSS